MAGDREKSYESGATGYIEKPINPDTFIDQVESFLKTEKSRRL
jgi:CheY-like chemotaxis protein